MWFLSLVHVIGSDCLASLHCNCTELHPFEKEVTRQQRKYLPVFFFFLLQLLHFWLTGVSERRRLLFHNEQLSSGWGKKTPTLLEFYKLLKSQAVLVVKKRCGDSFT